MQRPVKHKKTFHYLEAVRTAVIFSDCWFLARSLIALSYRVRYFRGKSQILTKQNLPESRKHWFSDWLKFENLPQ